MVEAVKQNWSELSADQVAKIEADLKAIYEGSELAKKIKIKIQCDFVENIKGQKQENEDKVSIKGRFTMKEKD